MFNLQSQIRIANHLQRCFCRSVKFSLLFCAASIFGAGLAIAAGENGADEFVRPWELRPYQVRVWICGQLPPDVKAVTPELKRELMQRTELIDPSAWQVEVTSAPARWRSQLTDFIDDTDRLQLAEIEELAGVDKLVAVCLERAGGMIRYRVREFDVQTGQWGALVDRRSPDARDLGANLVTAIERVFMPLARIERVSDSGDAVVRVRAIKACEKGSLYDGTVSAIENSPVWVRGDDRLLPIIRRVDRNGELAQLEPIPFTYLTVESPDGIRLNCRIHSRQRAALGGRSSKRAQKLALVIRPPESSTELRLVSRSDESQAMSGYEIYSRHPSATKDEESEFLGLTDWRGVIDVPPSDDGLRLLYVKHGSRPLLKLPVIPGLYDKVVTTVPDDEARLNAEGISNGFQIEILNLIAQRELLQAQINASLEKSLVSQARAELVKLQQLESLQGLKVRLGNEESRLVNSTNDKRELARITRMFQQLNQLISINVGKSKETQLQAAIQKAEAAAK